MRIGLIGTRHVHAEGLAGCAAAAGAELVGAHEPDAAAGETWTATPLVGLDELLERSDAVIVAGTNRERVEGVLAASAAGLPVLSEKPVAVDASDLERLIDAVDGSRFMVALPLRFSSSLERARSAIAAGALGTPLAARCTNHGQFPGGWFGDRHLAGGGALQDHIVHISDALCWMFGDTATRAFARASSDLLPDLDVESAGLVTVDFASGMFASIDSSWSRPESFPTWGDVWLELVGTEGRMVIDPMATRLELFDDRAGKLRHVPYADEDMTRAMVEAFLDFAANPGSPSPVSLAEGVHASDIVNAAYASVASGHPEPVVSRA